MRKLLAAHLERAGFDVLKASDGIKGEALAYKYSPDLILLDLMIPRFDGLTLCKRLKKDKKTSNIPILMITALGGNKLIKFNSGPDDYITKPFDLEELHLRIKALFRRTNRPLLGSSFNQKEILNHGPLKLLPERSEAIWFATLISLSPLEFELLYCLLQRHGHAVSIETILNEVWGFDPDDDFDSVRVLVMDLRRKLERKSRKSNYIQTIYGRGYRLSLD